MRSLTLPKILLLLILIFLSACLSQREKPAPPSVLAFVNGTAIKEDELKFRLRLEKAKYDEQTFSEPERFTRMKFEILGQLIDNKIIIEWGKKQGVTLTDDETAQGVNELKKGYTEKEFQLMLEDRDIPLPQWQKMAEENLYVQKVLNTLVYDLLEGKSPFWLLINEFKKVVAVRAFNNGTDLPRL